MTRVVRTLCTLAVSAVLVSTVSACWPWSDPQPDEEAYLAELADSYDMDDGNALRWGDVVCETLYLGYGPFVARDELTGRGLSEGLATAITDAALVHLCVEYEETSP